MKVIEVNITLFVEDEDASEIVDYVFDAIESVVPCGPEGHETCDFDWTAGSYVQDLEEWEAKMDAEEEEHERKREAEAQRGRRRKITKSE